MTAASAILPGDCSQPNAKIYLCVTPERAEKTGGIMSCLASGWGERPVRLVVGPPPDDDIPFAVWGTLWMTLDIVPKAIKRNRPFWYIDNGYWKPARGSNQGYYRVTYRGIAPVMLQEPDMQRAAHTGVAMTPWRKTGKHVVIALPGHGFGQMIGVDISEWMVNIHRRVRRHTDKPILLRSKRSDHPLSEDLRNAWALVTHSSNAAVDAARMGIPVFVEPTSAAAPVGNLDLADIERPKMPDNRESWWASLMCQQFSPHEMIDGTAYKYLRQVREQVDGR